MDTPDALEGQLTEWLATHLASVGGNSIALAVSGGADSMALASLFRRIADTISIYVFTVDHGLRHGSAAESRWTKDQLSALGLQCDIITLSPGDARTGNLQAWARQARYSAMAQRCHDHGIPVLCTAHTLDDQAETVLARLARASGTKGLSAMREIGALPVATNHASQLQLGRPLLGVRRDALRAYLGVRGIRWLEDPSNAKTAYDRVRLRSILKIWEQHGFSADRIAATANNIQRSEAALAFYTEQAFRAMLKSQSSGHIVLCKTILQSHPEDIQLRCLSRVLQAVSGNQQIIRGRKLEDALARVLRTGGDKLTLHGCLIEVCDNDIRIKPEK